MHDNFLILIHFCIDCMYYILLCNMIFLPCIQSVLFLVEPQNTTLVFPILFAIRKQQIMDLATTVAKSWVAYCSAKGSTGGWHALK